ncbi:MAG: aspartyl protease family protein [Thermoanaerobaculaceae bacterium]|jgi:predicted aspartyl protease
MRKILVAGAVAALALVIPPAAAEEPSTIDTLFRTGDLAGAWSALATVQAPLTGRESKIRCHLLLFKNQLPDAQRCFAELTKADPSDRSAHAGLAEAYSRSGQFAAAASEFDFAGNAPRAAQARCLAAATPYVVKSPGEEFVVPFERVDPLPLIKVQVNGGDPCFFIIDTGAGTTVLDKQVADQLKLPRIGAEGGVFAGGKKATVEYSIIGALTLGDLTLERVPVQILDTSSFGSIFGGLPINGVIGVGVLRQFTASLDYPHHRLELRLANSTHSASRGVTMPMWLAGDHLVLVSGSVGGLPELTLIDTGLAGFGCTLPKSTLDALGAKLDEKEVSGPGGGGVTSANRFTASRIALGQAAAEDVPCLFGPFPPSLETSLGTRVGLLVSHQFLKRFNVTFDFRAMTLTLAD